MAEKPPKKPFLGDTDLASELDAWDATFDALHEPAAEGARGTEQVMDWPAPQPAATEPSVRHPEPIDPGPTFEDIVPSFDDDDQGPQLDEQLTVQRPAKRMPATRPPAW